VQLSGGALPRPEPHDPRRPRLVPGPAGAALVGIDSLNIDDMRDLARPLHSILLGAEIPIVEHLCQLGPLPESGFRFSAVPPKVVGFGSWPVRAFATL
jgi:kynurenine formamidase